MAAQAAFHAYQTEPSSFSKGRFSPGAWELRFEDGSTVELRPADLARSLGMAGVNSVRFSGPNLQLDDTPVDLLPFIPEKYQAAYCEWKQACVEPRRPTRSRELQVHAEPAPEHDRFPVERPAKIVMTALPVISATSEAEARVKYPTLQHYYSTYKLLGKLVDLNKAVFFLDAQKRSMIRDNVVTRVVGWPPSIEVGGVVLDRDELERGLLSPTEFEEYVEHKLFGGRISQ